MGGTFRPMPALEPSGLLAMLRDPNRETQEIADAAGVPREEAARASRMVLALARAKAEDLLTLPAPLALAVLHAAAGTPRLDLLAAAAAHPAKEVAKEAKRAAYALRMKGVVVPEAPRGVGPAPATAPEPPGQFPPLPEGEEREAVEASARIHDLPLVRGWLAGEEALRALAQKLDEVAVSSLYLDERQRAEAGTRAVAQAVAAHFDGPPRAVWAGRLFSLAEHLDRAGDAAHARL